MVDNTFSLNINEFASTIAIQYHAGTLNKHDGEIYLAHVARVAYGARRTATMWGVNPSLAEATGWLHDVIEDTALQVADLQTLLATYEGHEHVTEAVRLLSKNLAEPVPGFTSVPNDIYYRRIATNPLARCVKIADLSDNFGRNHLIKDPDKAARMAKKYSLGISILMGTGDYKLPGVAE